MCVETYAQINKKKKGGSGGVDSAIIVKLVNTDMGESLWSFDLN